MQIFPLQVHIFKLKCNEPIFCLQKLMSMAKNRLQYVDDTWLAKEVSRAKARESGVIAQAKFTTSSNNFFTTENSYRVTGQQQQQNYCLGVRTTKKVPNDINCIKRNADRNICIKPPTTKSTTTKAVATDFNCKYIMTFCNNNNDYDKPTLQCICKNKNTKSKQLIDKPQEHQPQIKQLNYSHHYAKVDKQCVCYCGHHYPNARKFLSNHSYVIRRFLQDLISLLHILLLLISGIYMPLHQVQMAEAACRYVPSRSCEAICHPTWTSPDYNYKYQGQNVVARDNVTLNNFFSGDYNCTIRALVLLPDDNAYEASLKRVVPILQVAEERVRANGLLPSFIHFDWMPQDEKCDAAFTVVKAMEGIVKNCSHVIFGPVCDYSLAAVGRIAKYFNSHGTPVISGGGSTYDFEKPKTNCSDEFYMLLRTGMLSFGTISELTISVMKRNKWTRSIFFYDADGQRNVVGKHTCYLMMNSLGEQMRKENMTFAQYRITERLTNRTQEMIREIGNKHSGGVK